MIEDGIYAVTLIDKMFYLVEGGDIRVCVSDGEWVAPIIKTTRETIKIWLDNGDLVKVSDL
ncbi:hypothetical protein CCV08_001117 [Escherichia coli]|nr:hypothetical protein [Escherichia coli]